MKKIKAEDEVEKKQVIKEIEKKISNRVFVNLVIAILIMGYFCAMSIVYKNIGYFSTINIVKWITLGFLAISITLMEIAYKKESKIWAIHAFEILALAVHSLTTTHITKIYSFDFQKYILWSSYAFSIYYVLKTIIINTKARKDYLKSLSDIQEIVQKDEPQKKEATKKEKKSNEEENKIVSKSVKEKNQNNSKKLVEKNKEVVTEKIQVKTEKVEENPDNENKVISKNKKLASLLQKLEKMDEIKIKEESSKEGLKEESKEEPKETIKKVESSTKSKTKTATKKTTAKKTTATKNKVEKKEENNGEENKPKKRGRPKKEVKVDD